METNKIYITFYALVVEDSHGNWDTAICDDMSDSVHICGMKDSKGIPICFESDAYHLGNWCAEYGLKYKCEEGQYEIEINQPKE